MHIKNWLAAVPALALAAGLVLTGGTSAQAATVSVPAPTNVKALPGDAEVDLTWTKREATGSAITTHTFEYQYPGGDWTPHWDTEAGSPAASGTVVAMENGTPFRYRVTAWAGSVASPVSAASAWVITTEAPTPLKTQAVKGTVITTMKIKKTAGFPQWSTQGKPVHWHTLTPALCDVGGVNTNEVTTFSATGTCQLLAISDRSTSVAPSVAQYNVTVYK